MGGYVNRTKIAQLYADAESLGGQTVTVAGWVKSVRDMKNFGFVTLNDGSCFRDLQVVMNREALDNYDEIAHQNVSAALICTGTVKLTPDAPQPFELSATSIEVEGVSAPDYPLQKKRATVEFLRTQQHLRPRTNLFRAVFRIRSVAAAAIHRFFQEQGFVYVNTPIITTSDCEGAGEMFRAPHRVRRGRLEPGLLWQACEPHRVRPAQCRELCHGLWRCVHLWPHLPRRKLQHHAPRRRVLDD